MKSDSTDKLFFKSAIVLVAIVTISCGAPKSTLTKIYDNKANYKYDLIVVPGVPFEDGKWSMAMKARVYWSKYLYDKGIAKNVMYSGSAVYTPYYEAKIMALYAEALGIPKENIYTETKAEHSTENIYYSYQKGRKLGFERIALASDPFQSKMLKKFIRKKIGANVELIPIVFDTLRTMEPTMTDPKIDYNQAFKKEFVSLPDREGFIKRFRGTLGKYIDKDFYN